MADQSAEVDDKRPASRRVADSVREGIARGQYEVGKPLPPYRQLATEHGVAVNTAMAGIRLLREEGWVEIKTNAGAFVRDRSGDVGTEQELRELRAKVEELRARLRQVGDVVIGVDGELADVLDRLGAVAAHRHLP
ncbi:GntR family transcriptional regulator [Lentzea kristufekii]|uniref:GntR family transcriptional regulator n=1 Tax=Lentzea kristufekii TaxID=3095430 RepID=UPI0038738B7D